jgi:hypothetical protein
LCLRWTLLVRQLLRVVNLASGALANGLPGQAGDC